MNESFGQEGPKQVPNLMQRVAEKIKNRSKTLITAGVLTAAAVAGQENKASAQEMKGGTMIVHDRGDSHLRRYEDSAAMSKYEHTQKKYLGVAEEKAYNPADFTPEEAEYHRELAKKINSAVEGQEALLTDSYKKGKISEQAYAAALNRLELDRDNDPARAQEKFFHQAAVQMNKEQQRNENMYGKEDAKNFPLDFHMQGGELVNTKMHPTGEFIDKEGHHHREYKEPVQPVKYESEQQ